MEIVVELIEKWKSFLDKKEAENFIKNLDKKIYKNIKITKINDEEIASYNYQKEYIYYIVNYEEIRPIKEINVADKYIYIYDKKKWVYIEKRPIEKWWNYTWKIISSKELKNILENIEYLKCELANL